MSLDLNRDIAVIGIALKMPKANNFNQFWQILVNGIDCIEDFAPNRRKESEAFVDIFEHNKNKGEYVPGGYLDDISGFDYSFFNIKKSEAIKMEPHTRIMLETSFHAIEDSGYSQEHIKKIQTGIYLGFFEEKNAYHEAVELMYPHTSKGDVTFYDTSLSHEVGRILGLSGPSIVIDTACSSSLVAVHMACNDLIDGNCEMAIAGGISLIMLPFKNSGLSVNSTENKTMTFDNRADGTAAGEGCAAIVLKPYKEALKDNDAIYAVIKGSSVNQDGRTIGITAPSMSAQVQVITEAWRKAGIHPDELVHIEAHGTGTKLGDPTECAAIKKAFLQHTNKKQICAIGSIKTNIGHLEACAGIAGLLKAIGISYFGELPPTLHFQYPNTKIDFINSPLYINERYNKIKTSTERIYCGISSFGVSGTNCHMVIEGSLRTEESNNCVDKLQIITFSAQSEYAILKLIEAYVTWDFGKASINSICYTANRGRDQYPYRIAMLVNSIEDLRNKAHKIISGSVYFDNVYFSSQFQNKYTKSKENEIGNAFVNGEIIDWEDYYHKISYPKAHLPGYPFEHEACWVKPPQKHIISNIGSFLHDIVWEESDIMMTEEDNKSILVIKDGSALCDIFIKEMRLLRNNIFDATIGKQCIWENSSSLVIAHNFDGFSDILNDMKSIDKIVYFIPSELANSICKMESNLEKGLYRAFNLFNEINHNYKNKIEIIFIVRYANKISNTDQIIAENAPIIGLGKTARMENLHLKCRYIDIDYYTEVKYLINEIKSECYEFIVGYRNNKRHVERVNQFCRPWRLHNNILTDNVNIIIAGGVGGIGNELCKYISKTRKNINLILISRTGRQVESVDDPVFFYPADISDEEQMAQVANAIYQRFGEVQCIIQCTSSKNDDLLTNMELAQFQDAIESKIKGTRLLGDMADRLNAKFMILFSSVYALIGGIGAGAYVSSNSYLDSFAYTNPNYKIITIDWPVWLNTGMAKNEMMIHNKDMFFPLSVEKAIEIMELILCMDQERLIVGQLNYSVFSDIMQYMPFTLKQEDDKNELQNHTVFNHKAINEAGILNIISEIFGSNHIKMEDNFFEIGGDSIFALKIINRIAKLFGIKLEIAQFFNYPIIGDFIHFVLSLKQDDDLAYPIMHKAEKKPYYPVSSSQSRMFILNKMTLNNSAYTLTETVYIDGKLNIEKLKIAFNQVITRHEILRTTYHIRNDNVVQIIHEPFPINIEFISMNEENITNIDNEISDDISFDLSKLPLFTVKLVEINENKHILSYTLHTIIMDGKSRALLIYEIANLYMGNKLPALNYQYKDYAEWQYLLMKKDLMKNQEKYWLSQFHDELPRLDFPYDKPRPREVTYQGALHYMVLEPKMYNSLKMLAKEYSTTLFSIMISIYAILLSRYSQKRDIVIGTVVEGRFHDDLENVIGMFLNTLALRIKLPNDILYYQFLMEVKRYLMTAYQNQDYPFDDLVDKLRIRRKGNRSPLFDVMFVMHHNYPFDFQLRFEELEFAPYNSKSNAYQARFDLTLDILEHNNQCILNLYYNVALLNKKTAEEILNYYIEIIKKIIAEPYITLEELLDIRTQKENGYDKRLEFDFEF